MRAKEIRERSEEEIGKLEARLTQELFQLRFQNFTNRLNATSDIRRTRRDLARVKTVASERVRGVVRPEAAKETPDE